jgi:hypothetical protein
MIERPSSFAGKPALRHKRKAKCLVFEINMREAVLADASLHHRPANAALSRLSVAKSPAQAYESLILVTNPRRTCMISMYALVAPSRPFGLSDGCLAA